MLVEIMGYAFCNTQSKYDRYIVWTLRLWILHCFLITIICEYFQRR